MTGLVGLFELPNSLDMNPVGCCSTCGVDAGVAGSDLLDITAVGRPAGNCDLVASVGLLFVS